MEIIWYQRFFEDNFSNLIKPGKVFILYGPRRVGKTKLMQKLISRLEDLKIFSDTGDNMEIREIFASQRLSTLKAAFGSYDLIFIDEAQRIPDVGNALKLLVDHFPEMIILTTGSSSFDLSNKLGEPLTGRNVIRTLMPISVIELSNQFGGIRVVQMLNELLIFGSYPEALSTSISKDKIEYLISIRDSYLLKDILEMENIRNAAKITDLLKLLAFQIGHEVSVNELSRSLGIAKQTVERYLDLLEKTFIIKKTGGFSRNLRKEVTKTSRYYFWDNGIRNSIINNFNPPDQRNDMGMLWENFLFMERQKTKSCLRISSNDYFWRTYDGQEIDLIEERDGNLFAYEFKWGKGKLKAPKAWIDNYPEAQFLAVTKDNFLEFLLS